jgi:hypothetical protein
MVEAPPEGEFDICLFHPTAARHHLMDGIIGLHTLVLLLRESFVVLTHPLETRDACILFFGMAVSTDKLTARPRHEVWNRAWLYWYWGRYRQHRHGGRFGTFEDPDHK